MGQEIKDKFSGATEAFARKNVSATGFPGDHLRHRSSDRLPSSRDVVSYELDIFLYLLTQQLFCTLFQLSFQFAFINCFYVEFLLVSNR